MAGMDDRISGIGQQLRRSLDRVSFEADKLMRANRVRGEANRLRKDADEKVLALGQKVLELIDAGTVLDPALTSSAEQVKSLQALAAKKDKEAEAIGKEEWVEPPAPPSPPYPLVPGSQGGQAQTPVTPTPPAEPTQAAPPEPEGDTIICPTCGAVARAGAAFCATCGRKLTE